ncbi:MAG: hypothetical protein IPP49_20285 [Saprospiraceae bacterium]|nr:hypothetical protein [Saprospiraceae bacterium]
MRHWIIGILSIAAMFLSACTDTADEVVEGKSPLYGSWDDISNIKTEGPRAFTNAGKIITAGAYIYVNEAKKGIHVIDNSDPADPRNIAFWAISGNSEFIIKDNVLYADNGRHIFVIDISSIQQIKVLETLRDIYDPSTLEEFPPNYKGPFECYTYTKGLLLGWENKSIVNPLCRTI